MYVLARSAHYMPYHMACQYLTNLAACGYDAG